MGKKLIEVALPLDAINRAAAKEKSIRHGHPSTLHLWWARRPLAAARAVIFSQMVDDPSEYLDDPKEIERERDRLFALIEELVLWENTTNEQVLERARAEIRRSWARHCLGNGPVAELTDKQISAKLADGEIDPLPAFHDPFAGGGALPLEAQRLGLEAYASDLNPVAVLINKAMIEIPPKFAGMPPVNPESRDGELGTKPWKGAQGLAEDVRYYGKWMRDEAFKRIGHLYPNVEITEKLAKGRDDLAPSIGGELKVIAWIWARTVKSPNPAFSHVDVPLISTYVLSKKRGKEAWLEPIVEGETYRFEVRRGEIPAAAKKGTKLGRGANFECILSGAPLAPGYLKEEGQAGRMGSRLIALVCDSNRGRVYVTALADQEQIAKSAIPEWMPEQEFFPHALGFRVQLYGMTRWGDLFTSRQLVALTAFADLVREARLKCRLDARESGASDDAFTNEYCDAIATYLGLSASKATRFITTLSVWRSDEGKLSRAFGRQVVPITWDYAETNPFSSTGGDFVGLAKGTGDVLENCPAMGVGYSDQQDARGTEFRHPCVISTDPPYYDNVGYADLSDYFYVWIRRCLRDTYPVLCSTMEAPKSHELVATPGRHGGKRGAEVFFLEGMRRTLENLARQCSVSIPVTIYYAFKQSEKNDTGVTSTGWETFLDSLLSSGLAICGTWPVRTEGKTRVVSQGANALASSIVLVCRKRADSAGVTTRRDFQAQLRREMPGALRNLQHGNIAPVDMAQCAIGPGMAIFSRYTKVVEADGAPMAVRTALALINEALDEILAEQEGELDADSRWAVAWFSEYGNGEGPFGRADDLSRAKNTSVEGLQQAGIVHAKGGKVNLLRREEMDAGWDPDKDKRLTVWEATQHLIRRLENDGESAAARLLSKLGGVAEQARDLGYRLYNTCERKGWAEEARSYNGLVIAWPELVRLAAQESSRELTQNEMILGG